MLERLKNKIKNLGEVLQNKFVLYALIAVGLMLFFQSHSCNKKVNEELQTYNRQLQGQLSDKERELQKAHHEKGLLKSELITRDELNKRLEEDNEEKDKNFENFKKEHNLQIKSKDKTIASLKQTITDGTSTVIVSNEAECNLGSCIIGYNWEDSLGRFKLKDPNILEKGNETFESSQLFKVYGEIWEQQDGSLQTRRLVLREVYKDSSGEFKDIDGAKADIVDSEFQYHNPPEIETEFDWTDLFRLRAIALGGVEALPEGGDLRLGLGLEFFNWEGLGVNTHTSFDFDDPKNIGQYLGLAYSPNFFDFDWNLGLGVSIGTPFYKFFQEYSFKVDLIFYLHE
jgi:hypothetical protein